MSNLPPQRVLKRKVLRLPRLCHCGYLNAVERTFSEPSFSRLFFFFFFQNIILNSRSRAGVRRRNHKTISEADGPFRASHSRKGAVKYHAVQANAVKTPEPTALHCFMGPARK